MCSTDDPLEVRVATVGRALPEIECKIVEAETGLDFPTVAIGEFCARGYNIMKGYYKMPAATRRRQRQGRLAPHRSPGLPDATRATTASPAGLKGHDHPGGENIYPKEIEDFIYTHPKVSDVQVIGVRTRALGGDHGMRRPQGGGRHDAEEHQGLRRGQNGPAQDAPLRRICGGASMNAAGKILKYKMREGRGGELGLQGRRENRNRLIL
jgi:fatty-acyl-CoA synthase